MPAIDLNRLHARISLLIRNATDTVALTNGLREIHVIYADRTHPITNLRSNIRALPAFNTPPLLARELELVLSEFCLTYPQSALDLIDRLWQGPEIELRQLASTLLGRLPGDFHLQVTERIVNWSSTESDSSLLQYLHLKGTLTLRRSQPQTWLEILLLWRDGTELSQRSNSVKGLIPLIEDRGFINLPAVYNFLYPVIVTLETGLQYELQVVIGKLAQRSPVETAFFLKEIISSSKEPSLPRFIRRLVDEFPPELGSFLRSALKEHENLTSSA